MTTDPIQHLRERLAKATPGPWCGADCTDGHLECREIGYIQDIELHSPGSPFVRAAPEDDARLIVALVNAAPALLAVAEAAREMRKVQRTRAYDASACAAGRNYSEETQVSLEQDCDTALAKLDEVKP